MIAVLFFAANSYCASPGTTIFPILKVNPSAYSAAMGGVNGIVSSQVAIDNPAILPLVLEEKIDVEHLVYINDVSYSMMTYVYPISENKAFSGSIGYVGITGLNRTVYDSTSPDQFVEAGNFNFSDAILNLGYGQNLTDTFSYGVGLKGIKENLDTKDTYDAMISLSGYYAPKNDVQVNFGVINMGPQAAGFDVPRGAYFGLGNKISYDMIWAGEIVGYSDQISEFHTGIDYKISKTLSLRAGYKYPFKDPGLGEFPNINFSGGVGFRLGSFSLDYAWVPYGDFGSTHRVALSARLGRKYLKEQDEPIFSIKRFENIDEEKKITSVAVTNFIAKRVSLVNAYAAASYIRMSLNKSGKFSVMDSQEMESALGDQKYQECQEIECALRIGRMLKVQKVIMGSVTKIADVYYVAVNVFDVESGSVSQSLVQDISEISDLNKACGILSSKIIGPH